MKKIQIKIARILIIYNKYLFTYVDNEMYSELLHGSNQFSIDEKDKIQVSAYL